MIHKLLGCNPGPPAGQINSFVIQASLMGILQPTLNEGTKVFEPVPEEHRNLLDQEGYNSINPSPYPYRLTLVPCNNPSNHPQPLNHELVVEPLITFSVNCLHGQGTEDSIYLHSKDPLELHDC